MKINNVLDEIFARKSNIKIIRALKNYNIGISGREVARNSNLTAKNAFKTLTHLEELGIINRTRGNKEHLFTLNRDSFIVAKILLPVLDAEIEYLNEIKGKVEQALENKVIAAVLFGSVVKKEESVLSDMDLCVITNDKETVEEAISELEQNLYKSYNVNLSPIYFTEAEFVEKAITNERPVSDIVNEGEVLIGKSIRRIING